MCADFLNTLWCYPDKTILNPFALQIQPMQTAFLVDFQSNLYENSFHNTAHLHRWLFCEALEQKREDLRWSVLDYSDTAKIIKLWLSSPNPITPSHRQNSFYKQQQKKNPKTVW